MSSIKTTPIDGDLAVTRDATIGGNAKVVGAATVAGNLTIGGWLDARNIKGPSKGLFKNTAELKAAYDKPHDGWWALVAGESDDASGDAFPARVFIGDGGEWVQLSGKSGQVVIDSSEYAEAVTQMTARLNEVNTALTEHEAAYEKFKEDTTTDIRNAASAASNAGDAATNAQKTADANAKVIEQHTASIATLNAHDNYAYTEQLKNDVLPKMQDSIEQHTKDIATLNAHDNYAYTEQLKNDTIPKIQNDLTEVQELVGAPNGIASLDSDGTVPLSQLPSAVKNVKNFSGRVSGVTIKSETDKSASSNGCSVVYNEDTNTLLLQVLPIIANANTVNRVPTVVGGLTVDTSGATAAAVDENSATAVDEDSDEGDSTISGTVNTSGSIGDINVGDKLVVDGTELVVAEKMFTYYANWVGADEYGTADDDGNGRIPVKERLYINTAVNEQYRWDGSKLVTVGSVLELGETDDTAYKGSDGKQTRADLDALVQRVAGIAIVPFKSFYPTTAHAQRPTSGTYFVKATESGVASFRFFTIPDGYSESDYLDFTDENSPTVRRDVIFRSNACGLYYFDGSTLVQIGGASVGNCYNVTVNVPKENTTNPYYTLAEAVQTVFSEGKATLGMQITFAISATVWKMYQYIGSSLDSEDFVDNTKNWVDMAGLNAGEEPVIIVNQLCDDLIYDLSKAIKAVLDKQEETGITYCKGGMVLIYRTAEYEYEVKQYHGKAKDVSATNLTLWKDFGGGSKVVTSDTPVKNGSDAFSTGGAYSRMFAKHKVTQEDGKVTVQLMNEEGEEIMEAIEFLSATNGGTTSGTIVSIAFENSPLYSALGATISTKAAIRSLTMAGNTELDNAITKLELYDRDSKLTVWSEEVNKASSSAMDDYSFEIDFSSLISTAGTRNFKLIATDETGITGEKNIRVIAEDVTLTCEQVLHVTDSNRITPQTEGFDVDMFKFANNQSDKGIRAIVDIKIGNKWENIYDNVINDVFTHAVTVNAASLGLTYGAYEIRMYGTSVASGVKGNTVYSTLFVVDDDKSYPLVGLRYNDDNNGEIKLYESLSLDVACYNPLTKTKNTVVDVKFNGKSIASVLTDNDHTFNVSKQLQGYSNGDVVKVTAVAELTQKSSYELPITINGSVIDATLKSGAIYSFDFSSRSNSDADKSIVDGNYAITLQGANYSTNGFVSYLGQNSLRIAENVKATLNHAPYAQSALEATGNAIQFQFATNNIKDKDALLMSCYDETSGAGFYVKGNAVGIYCRNGNSQREERRFKCGKMITVGVVCEPANIYVERAGIKYSLLKLYLDGEFVGTIGYVPSGGNLYNPSNISFDGTNGDFYLYYMLAYNSYYEWAQAHANYLVKLTDTASMVEEYNFENVLVSQTAEGSTAMRPSAAALWNRGIPYIVEVATESEFNTFDNGTSTSDNFTIDLYYYHPTMPWRSFVARKVRKRRQGTTSAKRPKKNPRYYLSTATSIEPLFPDYTNEDALITYALFKIKKVRVGTNTIPIDLITVKIDYSDSSGANDCGVCNQMNATFRALGDNYMTPAQRFYDGTWESDDGSVKLTGLELNHSTANHPVAIFRSTSDTLQNVYFEAKGNWKEDKGEQIALGFKDTPGYNKGCKNYQDSHFVEFIGNKGETIDETEARFRKTEGLNTDKLYMLSQYCGSSYRFMRYKEGEWKNTTGAMYQSGGKWVIEGDVLNPVEGFELLNYQGLCWWRGVSSVEDMMAPTTNISSWVQKLIDKGKVSGDTFPQWTFYFECMVDNDQLAIDYANGKKVPYWLYKDLEFCNSCDPDVNPDTYAQTWKEKLHLYFNVRSLMAYYGFTDYDAAFDQQAKNMQPMMFLEDGACVIDGIYFAKNIVELGEACVSRDSEGRYVVDMAKYNEYKAKAENGDAEAGAVVTYLNKVYDCDTCNGKDNDGGCTGDPEVDPAKPTDEEAGYSNPYAGWNSILWVVLRLVQEVWLSADGATEQGERITLRTVVAAMRSAETVLEDGRTIKPFSPDGALYYFVEQHLEVWMKNVSSYDGIRKYIQYTATADAIYFYALQGLGLTSLPAFIEQRWRIRDGYYQTGDFFSGVLSGRIACGSNAVIRIKAAKAGYFGVGNDASGNLSGGSVYLDEGEEHTFTDFSHETGALLYIYQADRMSEIDLSEISLDSNFNFSVMALVVKLILGGVAHTEKAIGSYAGMTQPSLGNLPFLETVDVQNTNIHKLDCSLCPRIEHIYAQGSKMQSLTIAETSPINDIALPATMTEVNYIGLPNLTYTKVGADTGLQLEGVEAVQKLRIESSPKLDALRMLRDVLSSQTSVKSLSQLRFADMSLKGTAAELLEVIARGVSGMNSDGEYTAKPVVSGEYMLTTILEQEEIDTIEESIDEIELVTVIDAYIDRIDTVNAEYYGGATEVDTVTLDNIGEQLAYYNGETYEEYVARIAEENQSIHDIINL